MIIIKPIVINTSAKLKIGKKWKSIKSLTQCKNILSIKFHIPHAKMNTNHNAVISFFLYI